MKGYWVLWEGLIGLGLYSTLDYKLSLFFFLWLVLGGVLVWYTIYLLMGKRNGSKH